MTEPTRPLPMPTVDADGTIRTTSVTTPVNFKVRGEMLVPSRFVIPVILVPGIMGSNLRATTDKNSPQNTILKPGEEAWRMPNGTVDGLLEATKWKKRAPDQRQGRLDPATLEVDDTGDIIIPPCSLSPAEMRKQGWGEVHSGTYGALLYELQSHLNRTFGIDVMDRRYICDHWKLVMECDPVRWGINRPMEKVTETELEKFAKYQYPVYAVGYNWLLSCLLAADHLKQRITQIMAFWNDRKHECKQVILITHSMGGLVARACAKLMPDQIAGVIHGVMPAMGAPLAYRRIACGTEGANPSNAWYDVKARVVASKFAEIAGETAEATTPVMAVAAGVLELLPNHLYTAPWLHLLTTREGAQGIKEQDWLRLPKYGGSPYDLYRDMTSWYRMINLGFADPAGKYAGQRGGIQRVVLNAIAAAEQFHTQTLDTYYHPNTYAFYGHDPSHLAYSNIRWVAGQPRDGGGPVSPSDVDRASMLSSTSDGAREVRIGTGATLHFSIAPQDTPGDDTVPTQSGAGPEGKIRQLFRTRGYGHKDSFNHPDMLLLTRHLIVKIVQGMT